MRNSYKRPDHRQAFEQAIKLAQDLPDLDHHAIAKQLDSSIQRETRKRIAAKAHNRVHLPKRGGTPPNTSLVLNDRELEFINKHYDDSKSAAIHDGLKRLMLEANGDD